MLRADRLPGSLLGLLEEFRPCFTAPTFTTFALLAAGLIARPAGRTVCGVLAGNVNASPAASVTCVPAMAISTCPARTKTNSTSAGSR